MDSCNFTNNANSHAFEQEIQFNLVNLTELGYFEFPVISKSKPFSSDLPPGSAPLFGLYGDMPLDRVWFFGQAVLNRIYNLTCPCPKEC